MLNFFHASVSIALTTVLLTALAKSAQPQTVQSSPHSISPRAVVLIKPVSAAPEFSTANKSADDGHGVLTVINGTENDAVVKLVDAVSGASRHRAYVSAGDRTIIRGIGTCDCILKVTTGSNWNQQTQRFATNPAFFQFVEHLQFRSTSTADGVAWSVYEATLHGTPDGNAQTTPISPDSF